MKLPRRKFLHLAAGAAALSVVPRIATGASLSDAAGAPSSSGFQPSGVSEICTHV